MEYNPLNWYWLADDKRVYASARQLIVDDGDADYVAWVADGNYASSWPRDEQGDQTDDAMQAVLLPYNLFVNLKNYSANARFIEETAGIVVNGFPVATDRVSQVTINGSRNLAVDDPTATFQWKLADGTFTAIDATQMVALASAVTYHTEACYSAEAQLAIDIDSGTLTTHEEVDAVYAAIPDVSAVKGFPQRK